MVRVVVVLSVLTILACFSTAVPAQDEKTVKETYRLPAGLVDYIEELTKLHVLGTNRSAVVRTLLDRAIHQLDNGRWHCHRG